MNCKITKLQEKSLLISSFFLSQNKFSLNLSQTNPSKMKHRFITLMLLLLGATFAAEANPVDRSTAREVGLKFMNANTKALLRNADELQWVTTYNTNRGDAAFYVFNT
jgi:hypothetical protein